MAKRSSRTLNDSSPVSESLPTLEELEERELGIDPHLQITYNKVTNLLGSRVIRTGSYTGKRYEWQAGETLLVQSEDAQPLKNLKLGERACCAGGNANTIFQVSEE
jgi:hypothetical protein